MVVVIVVVLLVVGFLIGAIRFSIIYLELWFEKIFLKAMPTNQNVAARILSKCFFKYLKCVRTYYELYQKRQSNMFQCILYWFNHTKYAYLGLFCFVLCVWGGFRGRVVFRVCVCGLFFFVVCLFLFCSFLFLNVFVKTGKRIP